MIANQKIGSIFFCEFSNYGPNQGGTGVSVIRAPTSALRDIKKGMCRGAVSEAVGVPLFPIDRFWFRG
jgi:hypothetical protein